MPLNPAQEAARYHNRFAVAHVERPMVIGYLLVLIVSNLLLVGGATLGRLIWGVVQSSMVYLVLAYSTHRRLQPWCPRCQDGGGGDHRFDPVDPLPFGGGTGH